MYGPSFLSDFMNLTFLLQTSSIKKEESPIENIKIKIENSINKALDNYIGDKNQDYQESHLGNDIYQNQYKKNFEIIKSEYKKTLSGCLSLKEIVATVLLLENDAAALEEENKNKLMKHKIYCFLSSLAFFEIDSKKFHEAFVEKLLKINSEKSDWKSLASLSKYLTYEEIINFKNTVFKQNVTNYKWTIQEDNNLNMIISKHLSKKNRKVLWRVVSDELNKYPGISQIRKPKECLERWRNNLKTQFQKGEWKHKEDLRIIEFVIKNGTKWSKLGHTMKNRTEHNLKNRFFGLLAKCNGTKIKVAKKTIDYKDLSILKKLKLYIQQA